MTLQELLDELRGSILRDDSSQIDGPIDSLWSDTALIRYIDEAQTMLAVRGLVLRDATTSAVTTVALTAGVTQYALHPSVIAVLSVRYEDDVSDMHRTGHNVLGFRQVYPDGALFSADTSLPEGKPLSWATDEQFSTTGGVNDQITLRVFPKPTTEYAKNVYLRVIRKPLAHLSASDMSAVPEIPEQYHMFLLDWAAYRALRNLDSDVNGLAKADKFRASFEEAVVQARRDVTQKMFVPMRWACGGGGFSWGR